MDSNSYDFYKSKIVQHYGEETFSTINKFLDAKKYSSIRVNTLKTNINDIKDYLKSKSISFEEVSGIENALIILSEEIEVRKLDIYENGYIYFQSLSSMLPPIVMNPTHEDHILDMCAAPGSKTSQIAAITDNACITACEFHPMRAETLKYNLQKLGVNRTTILRQDARELDEFYRFDKILLDAPCSGSGTVSLREDNHDFNWKLLAKCQKRQIALLKKGLALLKKSGELIYSTCSIFKEENEDVLKACLSDKYEIIPLDLHIKGACFLPSTIAGVITFAPNEFYEGFFIAKIRKK